MSGFKPSTKSKIHPDVKFIVGVGGTSAGVVWVHTNAITPRRAAEIAVNHVGGRSFIISVFKIFANHMEAMPIPERK